MNDAGRRRSLGVYDAIRYDTYGFTTPTKNFSSCFFRFHVRYFHDGGAFQHYIQGAFHGSIAFLPLHVITPFLPQLTVVCPPILDVALRAVLDGRSIPGELLVGGAWLLLLVLGFLSGLVLLGLCWVRGGLPRLIVVCPSAFGWGVDTG